MVTRSMPDGLVFWLIRMFPVQRETQSEKGMLNLWADQAAGETGQHQLATHYEELGLPIDANHPFNRGLGVGWPRRRPIAHGGTKVCPMCPQISRSSRRGVRAGSGGVKAGPLGLLAQRGSVHDLLETAR
jgi:hypothetical protein